MKTHVGDIFPESNLYIYNSGNMEKTNTYKIFDNKKIIINEIEKEGMWGIGTPEDLNYFLKNYNQDL